MKGIVNIEFVLSVVVFITTIAFVTMMIVNNIPFLHRESISEHVKSKAYQISDILLFDEGYPSNWNENNVARLGLSSGKSYELSIQKIIDLNDACILNPNRPSEMFGELGIYVDINITKIDNGQELTPNCTGGKRGMIFTATRFAVVNSDIVKVEVSMVTKPIVPGMAIPTTTSTTSSTTTTTTTTTTTSSTTTSSITTTTTTVPAGPSVINIAGCSVLDQANAVYNLTADILNSPATICMEISANNVTLECNRKTIDGHDSLSTYGIYVWRSSSTNTNITLKNCFVTDWGYGIYASRSDGNSFVNNTANSNWDSFDLILSSNNVLVNNTANNNSNGFYLASSSNNVLVNNTANNNSYYGFDLSSSSNNVLVNNKITASHTSGSRQQGLYVYGSSISNFRNNISESNSINGLPIYYIDGIIRTCPNNAVYTNGSLYSYMGFVGCNNITIQNSSPTDHVLLASTENSTVRNLNINYSAIAVSLQVGAKFNKITNNTANSNRFYGFELASSSNNNMVNNTANSNSYYGFELASSSNNNIMNNTANSNSIDGFHLASSSNNNIMNNTANSNSYYGFELASSSNNNISSNRIQSNSEYGIYISSSGSSPNIIYNNFFNNTNNFYFSGTIYFNNWNTTKQIGQRIYGSGSYIGGNFWANPSGTGYSQNPIACIDTTPVDGICDSPYTLNPTGPNIDYLPLK